MSHDDVKQVLEALVKISNQLAIMTNIIEEQKETDKTKFVRENSVKLLSAYLIEDRIAWHKVQCFGEPLGNLVDNAIEASETLWEKLKERGY